MKDLVRENNVPKKIKHIQFGALSSSCMNEMAELEVVNRELYKNKIPVPHGALDRRLGISDKQSECETCGLKLAECSGHFGVLNLELPVFHVGYFKALVQLLNCICKECARVLIADKAEERCTLLKRIRQEGAVKAALVKGLFEKARKVTCCPHCNARNGPVKKVAALKLIHECFGSAGRKNASFASLNAAVSASASGAFHQACEAYGEIRQYLGRVQQDLNPVVVLDLLKRIRPEDAELLGFCPEAGRPEDYVWTAIPVPPACIRPSVGQENGTNEDDITVKLTEIIYTNNIIRENLKGNVPFHTVMEDWDFLQLQCAMYIHSEFTGIPASMQFARSMRGFCQRLKGKQGRFRGNLSGKRVDFSARTVISPDPNLRINEVGVPVYVAKVLTFPEVATEFNMEFLQKCIINGPDVHPGANYLQSGNVKRYLKFGDRKKIARDLKIGDVVERHLMDGDAVLFNRQPSLHKLSIMCHFARVRPWRTFRFNECACTPYNADFDGDEMNLHLPQTEEARAEAIDLMGIKHNLVTPRNGQPLIAATQDFITTAFLLSNRDVFLDRAEFCRIITYMTDGLLPISLPPPSIRKPFVLWSGKQVFTVLMKPFEHANAICINLETKGRTFQRPTCAFLPNEFCPMDGYVIVRNSELLSGTLDKSTVGGDSKGSIFYTMLRDYGPDVAITCMTRLSKLSARWIGTRGFSIGINDVQPSVALQQHKERLVLAGYAECDRFISDYAKGLLTSQPGCTVEQTLEATISGILSKIRDDCGSLCIQQLSRFNAPLIMQWCGSKGSKINVSQMVACVGQQIISGSRIADGFVDRTLPHFPIKSKTPAAKGFVRNSFYSGLTPTEFFFHATSGREGLIDTAVKTAETGYMQRRLMKALEDLSTQYDYSVRNSVGGIVQFCYGDDGLDPALMEAESSPVLFARNWQHAKAVVAFKKENSPESSCTTLLNAKQVSLLAQAKIQESTAFLATSSTFRQQLDAFVQKYIIEPMQKAEDANLFTALSKIPLEEISYFLDLCSSKYQRARIEPGTAVGAIGAQSIGEPGTQMTLKTFHFAGVASMNVTLGVPRIKEIINASKVISTPIITGKLLCETSVKGARIVKGRVEKTLLKDVCTSIDEVYSESGGVYLAITLNQETISALQLEVDFDSIVRSICKTPKLKVTEGQLLIQKPNRIILRVGSGVYASSGGGASKSSASASLKNNGNNNLIYSNAQRIKRLLPNVLIKGIAAVNRAIINDSGGKKYNLLIEGYGLREVMTCEGIDGLQTTSNHIMEVQSTLGIEAARQSIANEIQYTMRSHGMTIDSRHVALLADLMTNKGEVLGITRFGISKMKDSVLMLASFEKTTDHLFDAALLGKKDAICGVSECIIMGIPMPVGTGMFKVIQKQQQQQQQQQRGISKAECFEKELVFWNNC
jgi:DNA-directed RNA polymerase III subunit RPC1